MVRGISIAGILGIVFSSVVVAQPAADAAGQSPAEQQRAMVQAALDSGYGYGACLVYVDLSGWQRDNWPDGEPAIRTLLIEKILPRYTQDEAVLKRDPTTLVGEYANLCKQVQDRYYQFDDQLDENAADAADTAQQKVQMRQAMSAARFLGQCQLASTIYFDSMETNRPLHDQLHKFLVAKIYSQDSKYLPYPQAATADVSAPVDVQKMLAESKANDEGERTYWADCDAVTKRFQEIMQQSGGP